ncbi:Tumor necrosis factor receptor super member 1B [Saguinus oedipus]|uniref:Tumor necrosis factor receptor super member 1B n=1 Tax=Saguinus oedipus TaxID=9490 RepID=A0ABQ9V9X0_SAGOE|nr:Tumor necrosis factor receptor super member 1B [Saguinus oedipus]
MPPPSPPSLLISPSLVSTLLLPGTLVSILGRPGGGEAIESVAPDISFFAGTGSLTELQGKGTSAWPARGAQGPEQQHLLTTAPSSSSSSLESSASASDRRAPTQNQPEAEGVGKASGAGEARASTGSSGGYPDSPPGGHGTQVNVTCIVNVCSGSDHSSQCSSQASATTGYTDASLSGSPKDEKVPFSKEECAFRSQLETPETLLQSTGEKPLPLGVPDAGMKPS